MARMVASEKCVNVANSSLATKMHEIPDVQYGMCRDTHNAKPRKW